MVWRATVLLKRSVGRTKNLEKQPLTLKDMGFLVFQIHGGGWNPPILEKRSVTPPNFIPKQQTVSHMKAEIFS